MQRLNVTLLHALCLLGCLGGRDRIPLGGICESSEECEESLVCLYGRCRAECTYDRDCPEGAACVASPENPELRVCTFADETCGGDDITCPEGLTCGVDDRCREPCEGPTSCSEGRYCLSGVCVETLVGERFTVSQTIDFEQVDEDLRDFPILVYLPPGSPLAGFLDPHEGRIAFYSTDAGDEPLPHEVERADDATGELVAWVLVPLISSRVPTEIALHFGTRTIENLRDPTEVWAHYGGVWHFDESSKFEDSTANDNDGHPGDPDTEPPNAQGLMGQALDYFEAAHEVLVPDAPSLQPETTLTLSAWVTARAFPGDGGFIVGKARAVGSAAYDFLIRAFDYELIFMARVGLDRGVSALANDWSTPDHPQWHHVAGVYDGSYLMLYFDGERVGITPFSSTLLSSGFVLRIGRHGTPVNPDEVGQRTWNGLIDEVRLSTVARSEAWIRAEYLNCTSPLSFSDISMVRTR